MMVKRLLLTVLCLLSVCSCLLIGFGANAAFINDASSDCKQTLVQEMASGSMVSILNPSAGDYLNCIKYSSVLPFPGAENKSKYCMLVSSLEILPKQSIPLVHGVCLPQKCNASLGYKDDLISSTSTIAATIIALQPKLKNQTLLVEHVLLGALKNATFFCSDELESGQNAGSIIFWAITGLMLGCVLWGTLNYKSPVLRESGKLEEGYRQLQEETEVTQSYFARTFSLQHNFQRLVDASNIQHAATNGIRVISMFWVIWGHTLLLKTRPIPRTSLELGDVSSEFTFSIVESAVYAVDTFFFLSGFFGAFKLLPMLQRAGGKLKFVTYLKMLFLRYMRLTPVYAFLLLFWICVFPYSGEGPFWGAYQKPAISSSSVCHKYWWTNMLYINNLYPFNSGTTNSCFGWTWYLANDMQFFLFLPLICLLLVKKPRVGLSLTGLLIAIQMVSTALTIDFGNVLTVSSSNKDSYIYVKPWARMSPYIFGVLTNYVFFSKQSQIKKRTAYIFFSVSGAIMLAIIFGVYANIACPDEHPYCGYGILALGNWKDNQVAGYMYYTLTYAAWGLSLSLLTVAFSNNYGGIVLQFLSHKIWVPFARLTYNAYLVHLILITYGAYAQLNLQSFTGFELLKDTVSNIILAYLCALVLFLGFEKPVMNIMRALV